MIINWIKIQSLQKNNKFTNNLFSNVKRYLPLDMWNETKNHKAE